MGKSLLTCRQNDGWRQSYSLYSFKLSFNLPTLLLQNYVKIAWLLFKRRRRRSEWWRTRPTRGKTKTSEKEQFSRNANNTKAKTSQVYSYLKLALEGHRKKRNIHNRKKLNSFISWTVPPGDLVGTSPHANFLSDSQFRNWVQCRLKPAPKVGTDPQIIPNTYEEIYRWG